MVTLVSQRCSAKLGIDNTMSTRRRTLGHVAKIHPGASSSSLVIYISMLA